MNGRFPSNALTLRQNLRRLSQRNSTATSGLQPAKTSKNGLSSGPTNAAVRCAGAVDQSLCHSPKSKPSKASRQRHLDGMLGYFHITEQNILLTLDNVPFVSCKEGTNFSPISIDKDHNLRLQGRSGPGVFSHKYSVS